MKVINTKLNYGDAVAVMRLVEFLHKMKALRSVTGISISKHMFAHNVLGALDPVELFGEIDIAECEMTFED